MYTYYTHTHTYIYIYTHIYTHIFTYIIYGMHLTFPSQPASPTAFEATPTEEENDTKRG